MTEAKPFHASRRARSASLRTLVAGAFGLMLMAPAAARPHVQMEDGSNAGARRISMGVGKSTIVDLPEDAAEIFVANPTVANAIVRTARKIYIIGAGAGQTSLFALDKQGHEIASFEINIGRDIGELNQILRAALPGSDIHVRTINDTIILTGAVDSAEDAQRAADMAKGFARQVGGAGGAQGEGGLVVNSLTIRGRDQVMLKVTISEILRDIAKQLGITSSSWGSFTQVNSFGINGPISVAPPTSLLSAAAGSPANSLTINPSSSLAATLAAFERTGVSRTLAEPSVTAISGEAAKFLVGGEFPYSSGLVCGSIGSVGAGGGSTTSSCTAGAAFKQYGISLNFEPVVLSQGRILLHLGTEITDIDFSHAVNINGVSTPGVITRRNETTVELPSGGSIAAAGLIQQKSTQVINGTPGLLNIPILGTLFRSRDYQRNETELMIIVTPIIVKPVAPNAIARPDDGFAEASDPQSWLLGRVNKLYATPSNPQAVKDYRGRVGFIQD